MEGGETERRSETPSIEQSVLSVITGPVNAVTEQDIMTEKNKDLYEMYRRLSTKIADDCEEKDCCIYSEEDHDFHTLERENSWTYTPGEQGIIQLYFTKTNKAGNTEEEEDIKGIVEMKPTGIGEIKLESSGTTGSQDRLETEPEGSGKLHLWKKVLVVAKNEIFTIDFSLKLGDGVKK